MERFHWRLSLAMPFAILDVCSAPLHRSTVAAFVLVVWVGAQCSVAMAHERFKVVPLKVNVLKGVTADADDVQKMVEAANEILKKANIKLDFDKDKNINRDVSDQGNDDGRVSAEEFLKLWKPGVDELKAKFKRDELGYKLYIANFVIMEQGTMLTPHPSLPGGPASITPVTVGRLRSGQGSAKRGNDLAHEICHAFTLGKGHTITPTLNADPTGHHPTDRNNLMFPRNSESNPRGSTLTPSQIEECNKGAQKWGQAKVMRSPLIPLDHRHGSWTDDLGDVTAGHTDLHMGSLFASFFDEDDTEFLRVGIQLGGLHPDAIPARSAFELFFDVDNDIQTGSNFGSIAGVDKVLQIGLEGFFPFEPPAGAVTATVLDVSTGLLTPIPPGIVGRTSAILDVDGPRSPSTFDVVDFVEQPVPFTILGPLADRIPMGVRSTNLDTGEVDEALFVFEFGPAPGPLLETSSIETGAGDTIELAGQNFSPSNIVRVLLGETEILTAVTDGSGSFSGVFFVPPLSRDIHFVTARDESGLFDFSVLNIVTGDTVLELRMPNRIDLRTSQRIRATILTTNRFDASGVAVGSVQFGRSGTEAVPLRSRLVDVDEDGDLDLLLVFDTTATGIQCGDTSVLLSGTTADGQPIRGSHFVRTVGCR